MINLSRFDLTHTVRCNFPCKQLFHDRGKYMRHASSCNFAGANTHHSVTKEVSDSYILETEKKRQKDFMCKTIQYDW